MNLSSDEAILMLGTSCMLLLSVALAIWSGWPMLHRFNLKQCDRYDIVLNKELLYNIAPRAALFGHYTIIVLTGALFALLATNLLGFFVGAAIGLFVPQMMLNHLIEKRKRRLEAQLVDGITTLASGVRAGLTLVQSMELLTRNMIGPIKQEFEHMLREYELGLPLNVCMSNAANRIGLQNYRLLFTAILAHRERGGDVGESLDRIAEAVREIQRLEGKLLAITAQGRGQASMLAMIPVALLIIMYLIAPDQTAMLFTEDAGRVILMIAVILVVIGFLWIRRIMDVDI